MRRAGPKHRHRRARALMALSLVAALLAALAAPLPAAAEEPPAITNVTVIDGLGAPVKTAYVWINFIDPQNGEELWVDEGDTGQTGSCTLRDWAGYGAGQYRIYVHPTASTEIHKSTTIYWGGQSPVNATVAFESAKPYAQVVVTDVETGEPIEGAWIESWFIVNDTEDRSADCNETGPDGARTLYDWWSYGPGEYVIRVDADGYASQRKTITWDGENAQEVAFALERPPAIANVTVTDAATGDPIEGAYVEATVFDSESGEVFGASWAYTVPDGTCTLYDDEGYGAGEYHISAFAEGYQPEDETITWDGEKAVEVRFELQREEVASIPIAGADRISTAIEASKLAFPDGAEAVVIATAYNWPDALGGASLAGAAGGPVLLTPKDALPQAVADEVRRLGATKAYLLGGEAAVSRAVENALKIQLGEGNVDRIWGANRYETARKVAAKCVALEGAAFDGTAFVATGANFPDALGASPAAAAKGWPIFLVDPAKGADAALISAMQAAGVRKAIVLGGTAVVAEKVKSDIAKLVPCATDRWAGADRYATAAQVAERSAAAGLAFDGAGIATGENFPDALAAGPVLGRSGSVMLLTRSAALPDATRAALAAHKGEISAVRFFGGARAIAQAVRDAVLAALK